MIIQLPNGLVIGQALYNYADVDELRGKQQNYLADRDLVIGNLGHIPKILEDMVLSLQTKEGMKWEGKMSEAIYQLPMGDIETLLIRIRENTYGPKFYHEGVCTHCEHVNKNLRLDLDTLEMEPMAVEDMTKAKIVHLPKSHMDAELKPLYLKDLFSAIKIAKEGSAEVVTSSIAVSIKRLGEKTHVVPTDIDNIPASDLSAIQEQLEHMKLEGTIDTNIQVECSKCKKEFEMKLGVFDPLFFAPTSRSKSTNI